MPSDTHSDQTTSDQAPEFRMDSWRSRPWSRLYAAVLIYTLLLILGLYLLTLWWDFTQ